jgi:photosystem II stability/assembly factor-like uncharacterized protein
MGIPTLRSWAAAVLALIIPALVAGGISAWTTGGPLAGRVTALAADTAAISVVYSAAFAGATQSVFKTTNAGTSWLPIGLSQHSIIALAAGPPGTIYAGSFNGPDFKSSDGGLTWNQIRPVHSSSATIFFRVDPQLPTTVYAEAAGTVSPMGDPGGELLKSSDGGRTWTSIQSGIGFGTVFDLAIDPRNTGTLYALTPTGVHKSIDAGSTWTLLRSGLPIPGVTSLAIDPSAPNVLYAGSASGLFKSLDSGASFSRVGLGLPSATVWDVIVNPSDPSSIYVATLGAGIFASPNGGATWTSLNSGLTNLSITELAIDPTGNFLHAATGAGVFDYQLDTGDTALVLNPGHRFFMRLSARDPRTGSMSGGLAISLGNLAGYFSIPDLTSSPETPEVVVKLVDGRAINGRYWVFHGALTDLEYTLSVTEEATGRVKSYFKEAGSACGGFDTSAFPSSP